MKNRIHENQVTVVNMFLGTVAPYLLAFCRVVVGLVFAFSAISKVRQIPQFTETIANFELLPKQFHAAAAILFLCGEFIVVMGLIAGGLFLFISFLLAIFLLSIFCFALLSVLIRQIRTPCNCFGTSEKLVSQFDIWRNVGFILCAVIGCVILTQTGQRQFSLNYIDWILSGLAAVAFVVILIQIGDIFQLFQQN